PGFQEIPGDEPDQFPGAHEGGKGKSPPPEKHSRLHRSTQGRVQRPEQLQSPVQEANRPNPLRLPGYPETIISTGSIPLIPFPAAVSPNDSPRLHYLYSGTGALSEKAATAFFDNSKICRKKSNPDQVNPLLFATINAVIIRCRSDHWADKKGRREQRVG